MFKSICAMFVVVIITLGLTGCGDPKIDTSSNETMKASIQKVKDSLPAEKQKEFEDALKTVIYSQMNFKEMLMQGPLAVSNLEGNVKTLLHNKTAQEVVVEAKKIREAKAEEEKKQRAAKLEEERKLALEEIKALEEKRAYAEKAQDELKKLVVMNAHFRQVEEKYSAYPQPVIDIHVKNLTGKAISRVFFLGTVKSPGREIPWIKETFNYSIAGGLESNEEAKWSLAPNMFSVWGKVAVPKDAILELVVERFDGSDEKPIASMQDFTEKNKARLEELKTKYAQ